MTDYVVPVPETVTVPVLGQDGRFPVRRIYCVGRNYGAHVREMGGDERVPPFFFQKPADAIVLSGSVVPYPTLTNDLHHEVELVLAIGKQGSHIERSEAPRHVYGLAVGIDLTRRDVQAEAKKRGQPWEIAKAFDHSAPISLISPLSELQLPDRGQISITVNGEMRQCGDLREMIWSCADVVATLSTHYQLHPGDLIYTGTPSGVASVKPGDVLVGSVDGLTDLQVTIGER